MNEKSRIGQKPEQSNKQTNKPLLKIHSFKIAKIFCEFFSHIASSLIPQINLALSEVVDLSVSFL